MLLPTARLRRFSQELREFHLREDGLNTYFHVDIKLINVVG